ncbi:MAG: pyridoxal phosphate-dependent aminotransferase [bacterium]
MDLNIRKDTPFDYETVKMKIDSYGRENIHSGNIRVIRKIVDLIEGDTGKKYIRMEMGVPGLKPSQIGLEAEIRALKDDVAGLYPPIEGIPELKYEISRFIKLFLNIDINPEYCVPTCGSIHGCFVSLMTACRRDPEKNTILFLEPGFPNHNTMNRMLGFKQEAFDVYSYRGEKLRDKLNEVLKSGKVAALVYSNPNNPSWICLTEEELKIIAETASKYDVIVIEDLAYFAMDFRKDYSHPGKPPYQPSAANYCDNYILLISGSKSFSYAGQRIGVLAISEKLYNTRYENLKSFFGMGVFGRALVYSAILNSTAGVTHSVQYGFCDILKAANDGKYNFVEDLKEYGKKAIILKKMFTDNGFNIAYNMDGEALIADGFYFTVSYPGLEGDELTERLLYYGISTIPLYPTGSEKTEGIRICVSLVKRSEFGELENRLKLFNEHNFS